MQTFRQRNSSGFTIVEMLVVIGIIVILIGLLLPALSGVQARGKKLSEGNDLRQIGSAWSMYANLNNSAVLPGYIEPAVQERWRTQFEYPMQLDPNDPQSLIIEPEVAAAWTWRLLPLLDYNAELVRGYTGEPLGTPNALMVDPEDPDRPLTVALEPAFGYNAFYVGGWLDVETVTADEGSVESVRARYWQARDAETNERVNVIARTMSQIRRPSELVIFSSASRFETPSAYGRILDDIHGSHLVTPTRLAESDQWQMASSQFEGAGADDPYAIQTLASPAHAPIGRYNRAVAYLRADGSHDAQPVQSLLSQRKWIDAATRDDFTHTEGGE